jgi:sec-independent protein translocase protein TatA
MLFGIALGGTELLIILAIALVIFGPSKLPQLGSGVGKMLRGFKKEMRALDEENGESADEPAGEIDVTPAASDD